MKLSKFLLRKLGWNDLIKFPRILNFSLGRKREIQLKYDKQKGRIGDLENRLFPENKQLLYRYVANDYPYNVKKEIEHNVLWFNPKIGDKWIFKNEKIVEEILKKETKGRKFIYFRNSATNSSVKSMLHYQVFTKGYKKIR